MYVGTGYANGVIKLFCRFNATSDTWVHVEWPTVKSYGSFPFSYYHRRYGKQKKHCCICVRFNCRCYVSISVWVAADAASSLIRKSLMNAINWITMLRSEWKKEIQLIRLNTQTKKEQQQQQHQKQKKKNEIRLNRHKCNCCKSFDHFSSSVFWSFRIFNASDFCSFYLFFSLCIFPVSADWMECTLHTAKCTLHRTQHELLAADLQKNTTVGGSRRVAIHWNNKIVVFHADLNERTETSSLFRNGKKKMQKSTKKEETI